MAMYQYESYQSGYVDDEPMTIITVRTRSRPPAHAVASHRVDGIGEYRVWWPWLAPVEVDLGEGVRVLIAPWQAPVEVDAAQWQAQCVARRMRRGNVSAVVVRYGVRRAVEIGDVRVQEAMRAWEAVQSLGSSARRART
jgi:hypothetical protein